MQLNIRIFFDNLKFLFFSILFFLSGVIFYLIYHQKLVIIWSDKHEKPVLIMPAKRRNFSLFFYKDNKWEKEDKELIDSVDINTTLKYLVTAWLNQLEEERLTEKQVSIQAVLFDEQNTHAFISFDRNPFAKSNSIFEKFTWLEGLLRTIKKNLPKIQEISLLSHHKPIQDMHLDFTHSFPTSGFLT